MVNAALTYDTTIFGVWPNRITPFQPTMMKPSHSGIRTLIVVEVANML